MYEIKKEIMDFVKRYSQDKDMLSTISELRLGFICEEELPFGDEKISILAHRFIQERMNAIYINELEKIYKLCPNVKPIVFKGIAHAFLFYSNPNIRFFNDLDLCVRKDDCEIISEILETLGYEKCKINNSHLLYTRDLCVNYVLRAHGHLDNYVLGHQCFKKQIDGIEIEIELHSYMFSTIRYPFINYNEIYSRYQKLDVQDGKTIYTLSIEDTLICSSCHLCKHIVNAIEIPNLMMNHMDMKLIIDLKILIEQKDFLWSNIIRLAQRWRVSSTLLLTLKLVNYVFPNTVQETVINRLQDIIDNINEKHSHEALIRGISLLEAEDIFNFNLDNFFKRETIDRTASCYIVSKIQESSTKLVLEEFDDFYLQPYWNEAHFGACLYIGNSNIENGIVALTIGAHISYLYARTFFIYIKENSISLSCSYSNNKIEKYNKDALNGVQCIRQNDRVIFQISWNNLNVTPHINDILPFNFKIMLFDETQRLRYVKSLTEQNYYNDYGTHSICLKS